MIDILLTYHVAFLKGAWVTVQLTLIAWTLGLSAGMLSGYAAHQFPKGFGRALSGISFVLVSIPVVVILFWMHYPLQTLLGVVIHPFLTSAFVLSLVNIVVVAGIVRGALDNFPEQYLMIAKVYGLEPLQTSLKIRLPLIIRHILPALITAQVVIFQSTLFAGFISTEEILRVSQRINSNAYKPVEIYTILALFFLVISAFLNWLGAHLKKRYQHNLSEY